MQKKLIEIENLDLGYTNQIALHGANLEIWSDDFIGIIGPNGGGKTTLVKAIIGLIPVWNGTIKKHIDAFK